MHLKRYMRTAFLVFTVLFFAASFGRCENYKYESHGKRDPFVPLVGIDRPTTSKLEDITSITDVKLEGIATGSGGKIVAILNGEIVKEGDKFGDIQVKKITKQSVTIVMGGKNHVIDLIEEGGLKSGR